MKTFIVFLILGTAALLVGMGIGLATHQPSVKKVVNMTPTPFPTQIPISSEKLTALVNNWRVSQGFQAYTRNEDLCRIATDRADDAFDNHKGFIEKYSNYPYAIQENASINLNEVGSLNAWLDSPAHKTTLEKPYRYSCIICHKMQCIQIFSNL